MRPFTGNPKVLVALQTPPQQRKGQVGYLVDRWHKTAQAYASIEGEVARLEREAAEARTQLTKAAGACELLERMIAEHEENTEKPTDGTGSPVDGLADEVRRRIEEAKKQAEEARKSGGVPVGVPGSGPRPALVPKSDPGGEGREGT